MILNPKFKFGTHLFLNYENIGKRINKALNFWKNPSKFDDTPLILILIVVNQYPLKHIGHEFKIFKGWTWYDYLTWLQLLLAIFNDIFKTTRKIFLFISNICITSYCFRWKSAKINSLSYKPCAYFISVFQNILNW